MMSSMRLRFAICFAGLFPVMGLSSLAVAQRPDQDDSAETVSVPLTITISRETTFVTGPLRSDGSVDYAAAINAELRKGVTTESNACVPLYQALGPAPDRVNMPQIFFDELGTDPPPRIGNYLKSISEALEGENLDRQQLERIFEQQSEAMSRPWKRSEFPRIARWIDVNEEPLRFVHAAAQKEKYYSPLIVDDDEIGGPVPLVAVLLPGVQASRSAARLLSARAMLSLAEGDLAAAWKDVIAAHRLGRLIAMGPTSVEGLVGYAIEGVAHQAALVLLQHNVPAASVSMDHRRMLATMPPIAAMSGKVNLTERCMCLDALLVMASNRHKAQELLGVEDGLAAISNIIKTFGLGADNWNVILRRVNQRYHSMVTALEMPSHELRRAVMQPLQNEFQEISAKMKEGKLFREPASSMTDREKVDLMIADMVVASMFPAVDHLRIAEDRVRQRAINLDVALSLAAFHADHAVYPKQLRELIPAYLADLPLDLFSGEALIYRRRGNGYLLYSVGENTEDEGGRTFDDSSGDDLSVRIQGGAS